MKCRVDWFKNSDNPYISCFLVPFLKMNRRETIFRTSRAENFQIKSTVPTTTTVTTTAAPITTKSTTIKLEAENFQIKSNLTTVPSTTVTTTAVTTKTTTTIKIGIGRRFQWDRLLVKSQPLQYKNNRRQPDYSRPF